MTKLEKLQKSYPNVNIVPREIYFGKNNKYAEWFYKNYLEIMKEIDISPSSINNNDGYYYSRYDSINNFYKNLISKFERCSHKLTQKDIYQYSFSELQDALKSCEPSASEIKEKFTHIVYEDDNLLIIHPTSYESHKLYGASTKWCTTSSETTFASYNNVTFTYSKFQFYFTLILIDKINKEKFAAQVHCNFTPGFISQRDKKESFTANISFWNEKDIKIKSESDTFFMDALFCLLNNKKYNDIFLSKSAIKIINYAHSFITNILSLKENKIYNNLIDTKFIKQLYHTDALSLNDLVSFHRSITNLSIKDIIDIINDCHHNKCNFSKQISKNITNILNNLNNCNCTKFNNPKLIDNLILSIENLSPEENMIDGAKLISALNEKKNSLNILYKSKKEILDFILSDKTSFSTIIINNKEFSKNEMLYLQVYSSNKEIVKAMQTKTNVPNDFAKEFLDLKSIKSVDDLINLSAS